jgi:hypothetical protein
MMTPMNRSIRIQAALCMLFAVILAVRSAPVTAQSYYVKATGFDINNGLAETAPFRTLARAVEAARQSSIKTITVIGELNEASEAGAQAQVRDPQGESVFFIRDSGTLDITITGKNNPALSAANSGKRALKVAGNSRIVLQNIVISGGNAAAGGGLLVERPAYVTLNNEAYITGNKGTSGGGVNVSGQLAMKGGSVLRNTAANGGGVFIAVGGAFTMAGGEITGNQASNAGGGVTVSQGCEFVMDNGAIWANSAQGGGGVAAAGSENFEALFTMNNGVISNNQAVWGSGVYLFEGSFTMTNGRINTNTAQDSGGGVWCYNGYFYLINGSVANNKAARNGGGVCLSEGGTLDMTGGTISSNSAVCGGGVYTGSYNTFLKKGGVIYGLATAQSNKAGGNGDAVYKENGLKHKRNTTVESPVTFGSDSDDGWE